MQFKQVVITKEGQNILAKAIAERKEIIWGKVQTTNSNLASYTDDELRELKELIGGESGHQGQVTSSIATQSTCTIHCEIENSANASYARGFGVYAELEGEYNETLIIVGTTGDASATYIGAKQNGLIKLFIDVAIKLNDYTATNVTVDASNYAQASALQATNKAVEMLQRDRIRLYETLIHAAAYAEDGDTFSVKTSMIRQAFTFAANEEAMIEPCSRLVDGIMLIRYSNQEDRNSNRVRLMKFDLKKYFDGQNPIEDTGLEFRDLNEYIEFDLVKVKVGNSYELIIAGRNTSEQLIIHRLKDGTRHIWELPVDEYYKQILAFNTSASGIALSAQMGPDMPVIYWFDEFFQDMEPMEKYIYASMQNINKIKIGLAGNQTIITTDSGQAYFTNGNPIAYWLSDLVEVVSNANGIIFRSNDRLIEYGEMVDYNETQEDVTYIRSYPMDIQESSIIGVGCNGLMISYKDNGYNTTARKYSWRGLPILTEQIYTGVSCGAYQFEIQTNENGFTIYAQDPTLDFSLCKKLKGEIVPVIQW